MNFDKRYGVLLTKGTHAAPIDVTNLKMLEEAILC